MKSSQELASTIKEIAKTKKVTIRKMLSDCELSINTLSSMKSGGYFPRLEALTKIADYLDCSVDYLLGRTETVNPPIPKDEGISDQIVNACRKLNEAWQERVALYAEDLVSSGRYQKAETLPLVARGGETIEISEPVDAEAIKKADEEHPPVYPPEL